MTSSRKAEHTDLPSLMRGVAGGLLLGVPLVFTQEIWEHGGSMRPRSTLIVLLVAMLLTAALTHYVGFERGSVQRPFEDTVIALGLSQIIAAGLLLLLRRIDMEMSLGTIVGVIALTSVPISLGFAIGNALAPPEGANGSEKMTGTPGELLAAAGGTLVLALNIAPTAEPILIAGSLTMWHLIAVIAVSMLGSYMIVFYAEFGGKEQRRASDGAAQGPLTETVLAYLTAFALCAALLAVFGRFHEGASAGLAASIVLALPGSLGGALGRMLV